jgi:hypothetical protein
MGIFATANGGEGKTPATFKRWVYRGNGQQIDHTSYISSGPYYGV